MCIRYPNVTNFYRHFQRHVGMTPAAFRKQETLRSGKKMDGIGEAVEVGKKAKTP